MRRRDFITVLGGAATWPVAVRAEQSKRMQRLATIVPYPENDPQSEARTAGFQTAFQQLGWQEGSNITIDYRWNASNIERIRKYAAELVDEYPDVILANSTPVVNALLQHTRSIPIVFVSVLDPVGQHMVSSFARPGGNATGFTNVEPELGGELLDMPAKLRPNQSGRTALSSGSCSEHRAVPTLHRTSGSPPPVFKCSHPSSGRLPKSNPYWRLGSRARRRSDCDARYLRHSAAKVDHVAHGPPQAACEQASSFLHREGALIAFGADIVDLYRRAAT